MSALKAVHVKSVHVLKPVLVFMVFGLLAAGGVGLYQIGMQHGMQMTTPAATAEDAQSAAPARDANRPLYWHDPMFPQQKFDAPGKSPFMDMQLVPVYAEGAAQGQVSISPRLQQNLGVRVAKVTTGVLASKIEAIGSVAYNERDVAVVQARSAGFIEKLYVRALLDPVKKGQALAALYVPEWVAAQEEYLAAKRIAGLSATLGLRSLLDGARQRLRQAGMSEDQIRLV